jgi:hypothetical protein
MVNDCWLPRIALIGQCLLLVVSGVLISLGHDSVITDIFCACSGGLITGHVVSKVKTAASGSASGTDATDGESTP